jgi:phosphatidylglycerophosphatase A
VAEGFGIGRFPFGPGTLGSFLGLIWFAFLILFGSLPVFFIGLGLGLVLSVIVCGQAERITGKKDPGSVVLDEITALPICFVPWLLIEYSQGKEMPVPNYFFGPRTIWMSFILFGLFRLLDIWKPWPIRPSQRLPGGWGVTIDDVLAAIVVALLSWIALQ